MHPQYSLFLIIFINSFSTFSYKDAFQEIHTNKEDTIYMRNADMINSINGGINNLYNLRS